MAITLIIVENNNLRQVTLGAEAIVLGRSPECQVVLGDPLLNDKHCSFLLVGQRVYLTDLRTEEGTFINEKRIADAPVYIGDRIRIGSIGIFLDPQTMSEEEKRLHSRGPSERPVDQLAACDSEIIRQEQRPVGEGALGLSREIESQAQILHEQLQYVPQLVRHYLQLMDEAAHVVSVAGGGDLAQSIQRERLDSLKREIEDEIIREIKAHLQQRLQDLGEIETVGRQGEKKVFDLTHTRFNLCLELDKKRKTPREMKKKAR